MLMFRAKIIPTKIARVVVNQRDPTYVSETYLKHFAKHRYPNANERASERISGRRPDARRPRRILFAVSGSFRRGICRSARINVAIWRRSINTSRNKYRMTRHTRDKCCSVVRESKFLYNTRVIDRNNENKNSHLDRRVEIREYLIIV